ncbi:hypothetical protein [Limnochorda pilosa]|uniref:Uncharacterized protein n=1 Tax=Limnochorda pilosa TaxID=1555112 RepID=A0A0K2SP00_LIMPI|nr:hypothetical protein [Limnochorda pilosa]BAS28717.1 hypothetical protein LIP_2888 [Limnochorda pilosa]
MNHRPSRTAARVAVVLALFTVVLLVALPAAASAQTTFTLFVGSSAHAPLAVIIEQQNEDTLYIESPEWETKPFYEAPYYSIRVGHGEWDVELIHDKMYLMNTPPEVQHFEVSHGYNLLLLNHRRGNGPFTWRTGLGLVAAHPESTVRGEGLGYGQGILKGFYIGGPAGQVAATYTRDLLGPLYLTAEAKATLAWAKVPVYNGHATVPHLAAHLLAGVGVRLW